MNEPGAHIYVSDEVREVQRLHQDLFTDAFRRLPIHEQLEQQARRIHTAHASGDRAVATHITCWHPKQVGHPIGEIMASDFTLDDARETIAREYGFEDWSDAQVYARGTVQSLFATTKWLRRGVFRPDHLLRETNGERAPRFALVFSQCGMRARHPVASRCLGGNRHSSETTR